MIAENVFASGVWPLLSNLEDPDLGKIEAKPKVQKKSVIADILKAMVEPMLVCRIGGLSGVAAGNQNVPKMGMGRIQFRDGWRPRHITRPFLCTCTSIYMWLCVCLLHACSMMLNLFGIGLGVVLYWGQIYVSVC